MSGKNEKQITLGAPQVKINDVDLGYIEKVNLRVGSELMEKFYGIPKIRACIIPIQQSFEVDLALDQINSTNLSYSLGGITPVATNGTEVDKSTAFETLTYSKNAGAPGIYKAKMGPTASRYEFVTISGGADVPVIKDLDEDTTYVKNQDYMYDPFSGWVYWIEDGTNWANFVADGYKAKHKYKYTPVESKRIDLGKGYTLVPHKIEIIHKMVLDTVKEIYICMWKGQAKPEFEWEMSDQKTFQFNPTFFGLDASDENPDNPYGFIRLPS